MAKTHFLSGKSQRHLTISQFAIIKALAAGRTLRRRPKYSSLYWTDQYNEPSLRNAITNTLFQRDFIKPKDNDPATIELTLTGIAYYEKRQKIK